MTDEKKHYKFGGSTIERTALCPGSVKAIEELGKLSSGVAAERGTRIHTRIEQLLTPGAASITLKADEEKIAQTTLQALLNLTTELGYTRRDLLIEHQLVLKDISDEAGGTPDLYALQACGDLLVVDFKFGYNYVEHTDNQQLIFYACAVMQNLDPFTRASINDVHLVILQPYDDDVHPRRWTFPASEIPTYEEYFKNVIEKAKSNPDTRIPGNHCQDKYCSARATCNPYQAWLNDQSANSFLSAIAGEAPTVGRGERLAMQLKAVPMIEAWCKAVKEDAKQVLMQTANGVPGWTLAQSYGDRYWKDEKAFAKKAKELGFKPAQYITKKFVTPAAFERLLKADKIDYKITELVDRPYSGVKLVEGKATDLAELIAIEDEVMKNAGQT